MPDPSALNDVADLLAMTGTVAVLGAHPDPDRPAHYVPAYFAAQGWRVIPVNPTKVGTSLFHAPVHATLSHVGPVDLVSVFRPSRALADHLDEMERAGPAAVWFQLGIRDDAVARHLRDRGIRVVQDRCWLADHRAWTGGLR